MDDKKIISIIVGQRGCGKDEMNRISLGMTHAEYFEFRKKQIEAKEKVDQAEIALNELVRIYPKPKKNSWSLWLPK